MGFEFWRRPSQIACKQLENGRFKRTLVEISEPGALLPLKGALLAYALVPPPAALYKPAADLQLRESPIPEERRWRTGRWHVHGSI